MVKVIGDVAKPCIIELFVHHQPLSPFTSITPSSARNRRFNRSISMSCRLDIFSSD